jgi:hypothetical protein
MSWNKGLKLRMTCNKLRIDPNDGSPVLEYRIEDGRVERRTVEIATPESTAGEVQWQQLTPEQLISHVLANTVVAGWLARRFGVHALIRVCDQHSSVGDGMDERPRYGREVVIGEFSPLLRRQPEESANLSTLF